jgi:hypothetical protein
MDRVACFEIALQNTMLFSAMAVFTNTSCINNALS